MSLTGVEACQRDYGELLEYYQQQLRVQAQLAVKKGAEWGLQVADALQEARLVLYKCHQRALVRPPESFDDFLFICVRNRLVDWLEGERRHHQHNGVRLREWHWVDGPRRGAELDDLLGELESLLTVTDRRTLRLLWRGTPPDRGRPWPGRHLLLRVARRAHVSEAAARRSVARVRTAALRLVPCAALAQRWGLPGGLTTAVGPTIAGGAASLEVGQQPTCNQRSRPHGSQTHHGPGGGPAARLDRAQTEPHHQTVCHAERDGRFGAGLAG